MSKFSTGKQLLPIGQILKPGGSGEVRDLGESFWFGPLQPVRPIAPDIKPRQYAYQPGANLEWSPKADSPISFEVLRALADSWDLLRLVLETRKDQICRSQFNLNLKLAPGEDAKSRTERAKGDQTLLQLQQFFKYPDGHHPFKSWLRMWLEDSNVIDAVALYLQRDKSGKIASVHPLDGSTINRMLTEQGLTPPPASTAYQQVIYGSITSEFTTDDLLYSMRNERTHRRYGYSRVEQILITISIALRRQEFQLQYYTSGNMPEAMCFLPSDLPIDKVKEVQDWFDSLFAGDLAQRRRLTFLPGYGSGEHAKPNVIFPKEVLLKDEMDDWLAKIVCYNFGVSATALQKMMNRASAEQSSNSAHQEGFEPDLEYVLMVLNGLLDKMGVGDKYEFSVPPPRELDHLKQAQADNLLLGKAYTINEVRNKRGDEPRSEPEADQLGVFSQMGFIPIDVRPADATDSKINADNDPEPEPPAPKGQGSKKVSKRRKDQQQFKVGDLTLGSVEAKRDMVQILDKAFTNLRKKVMEASGPHLVKADSEEQDWVNELLKAIEEEFAALAPELVRPLEDAVLSGVAQGFIQVTVNDTGLVGSINEAARDWAEMRAAEMVGLRFNSSGELISDPNAAATITQSTRNKLREVVAEAFEDQNFKRDQFIQKIEETGLFSTKRAELIAQTEIGRAQAHGNLEVWKQSGMVKTISWYVSQDEGVCLICLGIQAGNPYPIETAPVPIDDSHPRCRCIIAAELIEEAA